MKYADLKRLLAPTPRRPSDLLRSMLGVGAGVLAVGVAGRLIAHEPLTVLAIAPPIVASAVVVFAIPASPLAQPRAVIGGNVLSALVGAACALAIHDPVLAGPVAAGLAVLVMLLTGTLHPPGAAIAFIAATGPLGWDYAVAPIGLGSALLCLAGAVYAPLVGRTYPHPPPADLPAPDEAPATTAAGATTCGEAMSATLWSVAPGMEAEATLAVLNAHGLRTAPVLDAEGRVLGLVRRAELVLEMEREATEGAGAGRTVGELLDPEIATVTPEAPLDAALPRLAGGADEVVVVDAAGRALGVITQTDALAALWRRAATS